mmetsp:Transcript_87372/g.182835  ORF Transcript_87372/g.182835 Transcript_87372/m.182835 type:complete len:521 (-) Transcript_87372:83-1645(-)
MEYGSDNPEHTLALREGDQVDYHVALPSTKTSSIVSAQRQQMMALAKAGQENAILAAVRKQMEALEDKLCAQIVRVQQQGDKMREAAFVRCDQKLALLEGNQPRVDRRLSELLGNFRGLSDEMQSQIRRCDQSEARMTEWKQTWEEEVRTRLGELEQSNQQLSSSLKVYKTMTDDICKKYNLRLLRLEGLMEERVAGAEDMNHSILQMHVRLSELEHNSSERERNLAIALNPNPNAALVEHDFDAVAAGTLAVKNMEAQVSDLQRQLESVQAESNSLLSRMESQEERYKSMRTLSETKEEQYRTLLERFDRENFEGRLKDLQAKIQEHHSQRQESIEQIEVLSHRANELDAGHSELTNAIRRLQERSTEALAGIAALSPTDGLLGGVPLPASSYPATQRGAGGESWGYGGEGGGRLKDLESRVETLNVEVETLRADADLSGQVANLVTSLKDVAPKVILHDSSLKQLQHDLGEAISRHSEMERMVGNVKGQVQSLSLEVNRLVSEVEGTDGATGVGNLPG